MSPTANIILGIVSGIITSAILFIIVRLFNSIILPWYQQLVYAGVDVSGTWYCYPEYQGQHAKVIFEQSANKVTGTAVFISDEDGDFRTEKLRTFSFSGIVNDGFVQITLKHIDRSRLGLVSYLLEVVGDGRTMKGAASYYEVQSCIIDTTPLLITRDALTKEQVKEYWAELSADDEEAEEETESDGPADQTQKSPDNKELISAPPTRQCG